MKDPHQTTEADHSEVIISPNSATAQVLRLPELLELVISHLTPRDLLLSQRVSRLFRDIIQRSPSLQRRLFFLPDWHLESRPFDPYDDNNRPGRKPENNRLLRYAFPANYPTVSLNIVGDGPGPTAQDLDLGRRGLEHWSWDVCISFPDEGRLPSTAVKAVLRPEASWRRMYLSQPPCTSLFLVRRLQRSGKAVVECESGITMGDVVEAAMCSGRGGGGGGTGTGTQWQRAYVGIDRDWHFEGNLSGSGNS